MIRIYVNYVMVALVGYSFGLYGIDQEFIETMSPIVTHTKHLVAAYKSGKLQLMPTIAIAGSPAVGKSHFAMGLAALLQREGMQVAVIRQDDFLEFKPVSGAIIHQYLNVIRLHRTLALIRSGAPEVVKPFINKMQLPYRMEDRVVSYAGTDVLIFEGVYSLCGPETFDLYKHCTFGIFVDADEKDVCKWHWQREQTKPSKVRRTRSKFKKDIKANMQDYHAHILPCKGNANFVVYKKEKNRYLLRQIKN